MDDPRLQKECRALAKKECANCHDGRCVPQDCPCFVYEPRGWVCTWFLNAVLPMDKPLLAAVKEKMGETPVTGKNCTVCGKSFLPASNRQRYCPDCAREAARVKHAKRSREYRTRVSA